MSTSIIDKVVEHLHLMPQNLQQKVLNFTQTLSTKPIQGTPGHRLLRFAGAIPSADLHLMQTAIEQDCGQIDIHEW
ncbi:MAG: hypothetical protein ACPGVO_20405 [Spirulinaceae cyanobacterium]